MRARYPYTCVFLGALVLGVTLPAATGAQPANYLIQWGTSGSGDGQFNNPTAVAVDADGYVYVTDSGNYRVQKFTASGVYVTQWGSLGGGNGRFDGLSGPLGVAKDGSGNILVTDWNCRGVKPVLSWISPRLHRVITRPSASGATAA